MKKERNYSIDLIKIVSIYFVIVSHVSFYFMYVYNNGDNSFGVYFNRMLGQFGVVTFFIASGYFILNNKRDNQCEYIKSKVITIILPLVAWLVIYYIFDYFLLKSQGKEVMPFFQFISVTDVSEASPLWFIYAIIPLYLFTPFLRGAFLPQYKKSLFAFLIAIITIGNLETITKIVSGIFDENIKFSWELYRISEVSGLFAFMIGGYMGMDKTQKTTKYIELLICISCLWLLTLLAQKWGFDWFYSHRSNFILLLSGIYFFKFVASLKIKNEMLIKAIKYIGPSTLGVYLTHNLFVMEINGSIIKDKIMSFSLFNHLPTFLFILLYAFIACCLALVLTKILEKIKGVKKIVTIN